MKNSTIKVLTVLFLGTLAACSQQNQTVTSEDAEVELTNQNVEEEKSEPHRYGGWYCPDNLNGFPAVDIANWENVPVVNDRMATKEEAQNGTSLIFVDMEKYPNAKPLDITMPKLARYYNRSTEREDLIIVIQALNIDNDSIVGFRFINGGNGSARLSEINLLSENEVAKIPTTRFVSQTLEIKATQAKIWEIITNADNAESLRPTFDSDNKLKSDWRAATNVNYHNENTGARTAAYADMLYGCYYVQNDYEQFNYSEKFWLLENQETGITELKIVCGPFAADFEAQQAALSNWGKQVKALSETE
jgi:hypothetical protein